MATASVKGGLFAQYGTTIAQIQGVAPHRRFISMMFSRMRGLREIMLTMNGNIIGGAALEQNKRVEANVELGGKRVIETQTLVDRITTIDDKAETNIDIYTLSSKTHDPTPVPNLDRNPLGTR